MSIVFSQKFYERKPKDPSTWNCVCPHCQGRAESKGIRRLTRRFRCTKCKRNLASVPLTEEEITKLVIKDKQIGILNLIERQQEIENLKRKRKAYCLLPKVDPKYKSTQVMQTYEVNANILDIRLCRHGELT